MAYNFFASIARMKYINRWSLMRSSHAENLSEHSMEVAILSHALCTIGNVRFGKHLDAEKAALIGLYHDASEIMTGDMPTPVKYRNNELRDAYKEVEKTAINELLCRLPGDIRPIYEEIFFSSDLDSSDSEREEESYMRKLVKAADKLSAYLKCLEEESQGNTDFRTAKDTLWATLRKMSLSCPELTSFISDFLPSYGSTLDELGY